MEIESTKPVKTRRTFKEVTVARIYKSIDKINAKLAKYSALVEEKKELESLLLTLRPISRQEVKVEMPPDNTDLHYNPNNTTPTSQQGIVLGMNLPVNFTPDDLMPLLENNKQQVFQWIASWKRRGWIQTVARGLYGKTVTFGK